MRAIRTRRHKLIWNIDHQLEFPGAIHKSREGMWATDLLSIEVRDSYVHRPAFELYDLENDPDETENLAAMREYKRVFRELSNKLQNFINSSGDPWAYRWPDPEKNV
jgi:N-sulfoglucosamine sulfohydrolase